MNGGLDIWRNSLGNAVAVPRRPAWKGMGVSASAQLTHILGSYVGPDLRNGQGWITPSMRASQLVHGLIQQNLAASSDKAASSALASLIEDPALCTWRDVLSQAQDAQRVHSPRRRLSPPHYRTSLPEPEWRQTRQCRRSCGPRGGPVARVYRDDPGRATQMLGVSTGMSIGMTGPNVRDPKIPAGTSCLRPCSIASILKH